MYVYLYKLPVLRTVLPQLPHPLALECVQLRGHVCQVHRGVELAYTVKVTGQNFAEWSSPCRRELRQCWAHKEPSCLSRNTASIS